MFARRLIHAPLIRRLHIHRRNTLQQSIQQFPLRALVASMFLAGCSETLPDPNAATVTRAATPRILAMGDSMLAWHRVSKLAISDELERQLATPVVDRSIAAARFNYILPISGALGLNISKQYRDDNWDWVVLNGGGNDLWFGCGCVACDGTLDKLISPDAVSGKIPDLVSRIRRDGARVVYVGYLHSPGAFSIVDHCKDEATELENRLAGLASKQNGFYFLRLSKLVPKGDRSFHSTDMIHPSVKASKIVGDLIAGIIRDTPI